MTLSIEPVVDIATLASHLDDPDWAIVDCRFDLFKTSYGRESYALSHIPGAVFADLEEDLSSEKKPSGRGGRHPLPSLEEMVRLFSRLGIDDRVRVIAYDDTSGHYAARLWWMLRFLGHEAVTVLNGGWPAWVDANMPISVGIEHRAPRLFRGTPRWDRTVIIDEVLSAPKLIDGRAPERYRGEVEPIDPVAGHIPGAINRPYNANWDQAGRWRSSKALLSDFLEMLGDTNPEDAIYYCGSGVSACVNLLGAVHAGLPDGRLYVGSWSEWSHLAAGAPADPDGSRDEGPDAQAGC